jgi:hypothetical protein
VDLYADENEPVVKDWATIYTLLVLRSLDQTRGHICVYVEVDNEYGLISLSNHTVWFGRSVNSHETRMEIYEWLVEWELAEWKAIGPEDSELFATEKLHKP